MAAALLRSHAGQPGLLPLPLLPPRFAGVSRLCAPVPTGCPSSPLPAFRGRPDGHRSSLSPRYVSARAPLHRRFFCANGNGVHGQNPRTPLVAKGA